VAAYAGLLASLQWHVSTLSAPSQLSPWHWILLLCMIGVMIPVSREAESFEAGDIGWAQLLRAAPGASALALVAAAYLLVTGLAVVYGAGEIGESHPDFPRLASSFAVSVYALSGALLIGRERLRQNKVS
jgi:hypothetical protein